MITLPRTSGLSTPIKDHLAGGASRLAALLLPQILPVFSVVAPCQPGAALLVLVERGQATSRAAYDERSSQSSGLKYKFCVSIRRYFPTTTYPRWWK